MPAVEINLTPEQLISVYSQFKQRDRRKFLEAILTQTANQDIALELLIEAQKIVQRKFSPPKQRRLNKLLAANTERELQPDEEKQLEELTAEYGEDLVEKARAHYLLGLSRRANQSAR